MNTRILMSASAAFLAVSGLALTFLPQEFLAYAGTSANTTVVLVVQLLGALYLGFATLNWMNRGNRIGGIYFRPVSLANLFHFAIGGMSLVKWVVAHEFSGGALLAAFVYSVFAVWFGRVVFTHPAEEA